MKSEIEKIEKRPIQYWYEDGLNEIAFGIIGLSLGVYFLIRTGIPEGSAWHVPWALAMIPLLLIGIPLSNRMVKALKQKLTYPRTGFVSYRRPAGKKKRFSILGGVVGGTTAIAYGLLRSDVFPAGTAVAALPLVTGLIIAAAYLWIGMKTGVFRFFVTATLSALAGIAVALTGLAETAALGAYWGILGASHCISGSFVLVRYLRQHPISGTEPS
jgi:hypothetical protein